MAIKTFQFTLNSFILREAATMAKTNHENIVRFYSLEKMLNSYKKVIVMEICDGNVENLIKKNQNGFTSSEFKRFCQQFVSALHHLRNNDIIHRDIKPGNILLVHNNDQIIYKLADFGAARFLKANESYSSLYGTYEYSHPDIFAKFYAKALNVSPSKQEFNDFHELWSLGVTLFEVASGRLPFDPKEGRDKPQVMYDMIAQKGRECISAREVDGKIEWFKELPENCKLDDDLKHAITPLISGLLQVYDFICYLKLYMHLFYIFKCSRLNQFFFGQNV